MKKQTFVLTQAGLMLMSESERKPMTADDPIAIREALSPELEEAIRRIEAVVEGHTHDPIGCQECGVQLADLRLLIEAVRHD